MSDESPAPGIGCTLLVLGMIGAGFGVAALLGVSDRIELEFFGIELNDIKGRQQWVVGCIVSVVIGMLLMRTRGKDGDPDP